MNGFNWGLPQASSTYAHEIDHVMGIIHWVMVGMFVVWGVFVAYCLIAYRARPGGRATYHQSGESASFIPDALILTFEIWLIFAFGFPMWTAIKQELPTDKDAVRVNLVGQQFAWNFHYPGPDQKFGARRAELVSSSNAIGLDPEDPASKDDITTINNLYVPVNVPTILSMTSLDVIHNFAVAEFRNKHDLVPGLSTQLWFTPIHEGKFEIGCSQLCGLGHTRMRGDVIVQSKAEFETWLKEQQAEKAATASVEPSRGADSSNS